MSSIDKDIKEKWVEALRSGEFKQGRGQFQSRGALCCIAVGFSIVAPSEDITRHTTACGMDALGLTEKQKNALVLMNDDDGKSFAEIADYIEANL
jgi:hypothetical protein